MDNSIKVQGYIFLTSIYGGLIIGFVYDIYRVLRYFLKPKKIATFFEDLTFWIFASLIIFYILIKSNWGEIRGYIFIGFLVGTILYLKIGSKIIYPILLKIFKFISTLVYEFIKLILDAYKAELVNSFNNFVGKKRDRLVAVGPLDVPVTNNFVINIINECKEKEITKVDVLGFDYEMGLDFEEAKKQGIDIQFKVIPREVFDKRAVEKGQVKFYDIAYIEVNPIIKGKGNLKELSIELIDFSVFYNQDINGEVEEKLKIGGSKVVVENGNVVKISKDKAGIVEKEILTKNWTDWIDYWSVDFNFESKKEIIKTINKDTEEIEEKWTGSYIFENEWQSFRTKKDRTLELISTSKEVPTGRRKIAIKVIDIFGNDTTKVIEINI